MTEFTAPSGATVVINVAPWKDAKELKKSLMRAVGSDFNFDPKSDVAAFLSLILKAESSDLVENALWPCLARCTRNNQKIICETFDTPEARKDYYEIAIACLKENLGPLAESLFLKLAELGLLKKRAQESQA